MKFPRPFFDANDVSTDRGEVHESDKLCTIRRGDQMAFQIDFDPQARADLKSVRAFERAAILDTIFRVGEIRVFHDGEAKRYISCEYCQNQKLIST